jgi:acetyl esterase/lipase
MGGHLVSTHRFIVRGTAVALLAACGGSPAKPAPPTPAPPTPHALTVQKGNPAEFPTRVVTEDTYPERRSAFAGGVTGLSDLTYATVPGYRPLKLDLYLPPSSFVGPRPFVVYFHGGGWMSGTPRNHGAFVDWPEVLASLAAKGYVVASASYRLASEAPSPAAAQDAKSAVRWLRTNADKYNIDKSRGVAWGSSAGGQLASLVGVACGVAALEPAARPGSPPSSESTCVQGVVSWFGVYDFATYKAPSVPVYLRCAVPGCSAEEAARVASPVTYVDAQDPPVLLVHGDADKVVPPEQARVFADALRAKNVRVELLSLPGVEHALLGPTAEQTESANRQALDRTFAFLAEVIGDRPR